MGESLSFLGGLQAPLFFGENVVQYNFQDLEKKWQKIWEEKQLFSSKGSHKKTYYVLEMFPYPSGALHVGHVRNYVLGDVLARVKASQGFRVLHPIGWDAFGLPAENAALTNKSHPRAWTYKNIEHMRAQLKSLGLSYDWSREFATCDDSYFKHEQEMFIRFWKNGLIVRKEGEVNWDPVDKTILANEQVENGCGWRSGAPVEKRKMRQWFVRQADFAQELLDGIDDLGGWPESVRTMQKNWIGRSEGASITFLVDHEDPLHVFSTRPETLYGAAFCGVSIDHVLAQKAAKTDQKIQEYIDYVRDHPFDEKDTQSLQKGTLLPYKACHPLTQEELPIYVVNYVLSDYGTGAVFGCPAHDARDYSFAQEHNIPCPQVVRALDDSVPLPILQCDDSCVMINSQELNGLSPKKAFDKVVALLEEKSLGCKEVRWRLRDWCVSRQRYWGTPVPMIHCAQCGEVPVSSEDLPVTLPEDVSFDIPGNPLERSHDWLKTVCPQCGKDARRDTDTLDTFFESCWYFLRFISQPSHKAFDPDVVEEFLPVDWYIGGVEHAVMHLLYARLFTLMLVRCGYLKPVLPFKRLLTQGMICYHTFRALDGRWINPTDVQSHKDGTYTLADGTPLQRGAVEKMSKSKNNTVNPDSVLGAYGADALRMFVVSDVPPERHFEWSDAGLHGAWRFAKKLYGTLHEHKDMLVGSKPQGDMTPDFVRAMHKIVANVTADIEAMRLHLAVAHIRTFHNLLSEQWKTSPANAWHGWRTLIVLMEPFMPHLCAEIRSECAIDFVWPEYNEAYLVEDSVTVAVQVNGKMRGTVTVAKSASQETVLDAAEAIRKRCVNSAVRKIIFVQDRIVNIIV